MPTDYPWWGSYWFNDGSAFRERLNAELANRNIEAQIECVSWSGANSVLARAAAVPELCDHLCTKPKDSPNVVIAHSHGGNIAMQAIGEMGGQGANVLLVSLATPFLKVIPMRSTTRFVVTFFILAIVTLILSLGTLLLNDLNWWVRIACAILATMLVWILGLHICAWFKPKQLDEAANFNITPALSPRLLAIRGFADEASLALSVGRAGARLGYIVSNLIIGQLFVVAVLLMIFALATKWSSLKDSIDLITGYAAVIFISSILLPNFLTSVLGREFLVEASRYEITVESVPDSADARASILTLQPFSEDSFGLQSLRHSIYNHPGCVTEIINWLEQSIAFQGRHS
ncbi:hypothetical protein [Bradyrhizobium sp.]|uniref:hypothetical protein n=1 Tax=Bradyrhizobium sp. TaxID=376 RepID=UPI002E01A145|nr:hypothetical protein [Bradyrhizobium sp.]